MIFLELHIGAIAPTYVYTENCWNSNKKYDIKEFDVAGMVFAGLGTIQGFPTLYIDNYDKNS